MSQKYEKLKTLLKELFQLNQPDLDFGLYRIMHAKAGEVTQFLEKDLLPQVRAAFMVYQPAEKATIEKELATVIAGVEAAGMYPDQSPKVKELREKLANEAVDLDALESDVYDHLFSFFRRYYSEGDFLAKRVYKPGVYAIPYEGEEVTLHWANKDQYYIKTSEYLRDYAFRLRLDDEQKPMRVHFRLADAVEGEHGNVKAAEGKDRVFVLAARPDAAPESGEARDIGMASEDVVALAKDQPRGTGQPQGVAPTDRIAVSAVAVGAGPCACPVSLSEVGSELIIHFEYRPATLADWPDGDRDGRVKPPNQKDLTALAVKRVLSLSDAALAPWITELGKPHVTINGEKADYPRLEAHIRRYTARNTFDYFIHKDLGAFLRRELDFYIKNEVMHLDDIENETAPKVEQYLSKIKVIRKVAGKIIDFLAQLEDFQKKLWLKKKFVVETQYCITLGCIPEEFYPEIAANEAQRDEWVRLFAIDAMKSVPTPPPAKKGWNGLNPLPGFEVAAKVTSGYSIPLTVGFLKAHPTLVVDTRLFDAVFTARLLEGMGDVDEQTDGLLIHSENFQALHTLDARYRARVKTIYIDPPYNTDAGPISYKNGYRNSSWVSMMADRLSASARLLGPDGILCATIDDYQQKELHFLLEDQFGRDSIAATVSIRVNPSGRPVPSGFAQSHEYAIFAEAGMASEILKLPRSDMQMQRYHESDDVGSYMWELFRKRGSNSERKDRPSLYYPIYVCGGSVRLPKMNWDTNRRVWETEEDAQPDEITIYPIDDNGVERTWRWNPQSISEDPTQICAKVRDGGLGVYYKFRPSADGVLPLTSWGDAKYSATEHGTGTIKKLFSEYNVFSYPKSIYAVEDCIAIAGMRLDRTICLDFFAGSGTTGHAVINLNREDGGRRRFILVEMGDYFDTVLLPRIKKVTFTPEWKDGKPKRLATAEEAERSPRIVKVIRLESYEDALNNLDLRRTQQQQSLLDLAEAGGADGLKEQYILRYLLDVETRGSQSLLNIAAFIDPTAYSLKVKRPGSDESRAVNVDLLETFNYLIGLTVKHIAAPQTFTAEFARDSERRLRLKGRLKQEDPHPDPLPEGEGDRKWWFRTVSGTTPDGRKTLVIWRKRPGGETAEGIEQDNLVLDEWFTMQGYSAKDSDFDLIYVNGGNNLENLKAPDDSWKVRLIEEDFHRLMFDTEGA